jgi:formate dehydrogenase subunit gamma
MPILHNTQREFGWISEEAITRVAELLNLSRAEVSGVVSFYPDFRRTRPTRPAIKLCRAEACQARGVEALVQMIGENERVEIETVYCLGLCSVGPAALVGDEVHARLDAESLKALIDRVAPT